MAIKLSHSSEPLHFITFTCYKWLNIIEITNAYECVYKWFNYLRENKNIDVVAFVIMPNHVHAILYFPTSDFDLNKIIGNAKRFIAYEIIKRLKRVENLNILKLLQDDLSEREIAKGQKHKAFESSFDAKEIYTEAFFFQKLEYIHRNPISGKWDLADDYFRYPHSSAGFYETGEVFYFKPKHYNEL